MISNQILQDTIEGIKSIARIDLCVMDTEGKILASTLRDADEYEKAVLAFVDSPAESQVLQGYQFFKVFDDNQLEYVILAKGETGGIADNNAFVYGCSGWRKSSSASLSSTMRPLCITAIRSDMKRTTLRS